MTKNPITTVRIEVTVPLKPLKRMTEVMIVELVKNT